MDLTCNGENHHYSFLMIEIMSINHLDYEKSFQTLILNKVFVDV